MQSDDLTRDQARALRNKLHGCSANLNRLKRRMIRRGFPPDDPLLIAASEAVNTMHALPAKVLFLAMWLGKKLLLLTIPAIIG